MAAYMTAFVKIIDATKMQEYAAAAVPTIVAAGGAMVTRGQFKMALSGSFDADSCAIFKFANAEAVQSWYESPAYQALIPLRDQALKATFMVIEEPS